VIDRNHSGWTRAAEKNWEAIFGPRVPEVDRLENVELAEIVWAMPSQEASDFLKDIKDIDKIHKALYGDFS
jgi:hypothetical protein